MEDRRLGSGSAASRCTRALKWSPDAPSASLLPLVPLQDYGLNSQTPLFDILKDNFDQTYRGNKAPFPIYIHSPWFTDDRVADLQKFMGAWTRAGVWGGREGRGPCMRLCIVSLHLPLDTPLSPPPRCCRVHAGAA